MLYAPILRGVCDPESCAEWPGSYPTGIMPIALRKQSSDVINLY